MLSKNKNSSKNVPPAITEILKVIAEKYDISGEFQRVIEEQVIAATKAAKKPLLSRFREGGLIGLAKDALNKGTKNKLEDTSVTAQVQPLQGLTSGKIKSLLQGLLGLGTLLKGSANITPVKTSTTADQNTAPLPTVPVPTSPVLPVRAPAKKEEKDFIKDKEPQVVLLGGITNEGISDLQKKLPVVLKDVLDELKKGLKGIKLPEIKQPTTTESTNGGGLIGSLLDSGVVGTALDFFRKKKGTAAGGIARGRKAKQLRAERVARKIETPKQVIPKSEAPDSKAARNTRAQELRAERAARKAETGTVLKTAEKKAEKAAASTTLKTAEKKAEKAAASTTLKTAEKSIAKGVGKTAAKGAGRALLKSGLKKIPLLGAVAGLGFGAQRALQGDWLGAAGEVASGAAGSLPGLGTAASVGIDAALAARDISKEINQPEPVSDKIKEVPSTPIETGETIQPLREGNQDLKPVGTPPTIPVTTTSNESNPNKDILAKIAENTGSTNASIGALIQAIYKLAQSMGGKTGAPPIIVNSQQKQDVGPSASQVAAANVDPIRAVRSQFAL